MGRACGQLHFHSKAQKGESKTSLRLEPRKNGFHQLPLEALCAPRSPGGAQDEETWAKLHPRPDATLPHPAGAPVLSRNSSCSLPQAGKAFTARRRRSSKQLQDKQGTPGPRGVRGCFPSKDDAQQDWESSKSLNRAGLKPAYTYKGNTSLTTGSSGKKRLDRTLLQTKFALCEQWVVKQTQDVPLNAPLGAHGGAGLFPPQGCRFATRAEQEAV